MDFTLTNLGHVPCRFHLKLPRGDLVACDWAKGPIAPGMTIKVSVQLAAAVAAGQDIARGLPGGWFVLGFVSFCCKPRPLDLSPRKLVAHLCVQMFARNVIVSCWVVCFVL